MKSPENQEHVCSQYRDRLQRLRLSLARDDIAFTNSRALIRNIQIQIAQAEHELRSLRPRGALPVPSAPARDRDNDRGRKPRFPLEDLIGPLADQLNETRRRRDLEREIDKLEAELRNARDKPRPIVQLRNETIAAFEHVEQEARAAGCRAI